MMTFVFEDLAAALAVLQLHKTLGENDALWGNTASALHACCHGHPEWLIINGAGAAVTTLQKLMTMKIRCASGIAGEYCGGMNWGQPMLAQGRLVLMWRVRYFLLSQKYFLLSEYTYSTVFYPYSTRILHISQN